ncbi:hemicentin-1-like [Anguilla anguilla]|uniref:hemicentin-1-like n=1 Tax=Anguilla anguilla TaxID=7936 RepID=UPI0015AFD76B|nr:hemicentin-1-like [Anguilla anguilla]
MLLFILLGTALSVTGAVCDDIVVEAGSLAVLPCTVGSPPQAAISVQWVKTNGRSQNTVWRIQQSGLEFRGIEAVRRSWCPHNDFRKGSFNLHIESVRPEDGGEYICIAMRGKEVQRHVLRVIQVSFTPAVPLEGSSAKVTCNVTPWPEEAIVSWKLNGRPLSPQQTQSTMNKMEQKITSMSPREMGNWTCAVRLEKKDGEATQYLSMQGISRPLEEITQVYGAVGSPIVLPCVYTEELTPQNTGWQWKPNGARSFQPVPPTLRPSAPSPRPQWDRSLRVESVAAGDGGTYRCFGEVGGRRLQRQLLLVTAQVRSAAPVKPNAPVTLTCELSDDTGVTGYEWVQVTYDSNGTQSATPKQWTKTLRIPKMTEEHSGEWVCRYSGKQGILGNVTYHFQVMSHLEGDKLEGSSSRGVMATGLCFLVLLLLLIALQVYRNHRRRKMALQYPALETIVHTASNARERKERDRARDKSAGPSNTN